MKKQNLVLLALSLFVLFTGSSSFAATIEELERRLDLVTAELQQMKNESAVTEPEYNSEFGFGPAASKVYSLSQGLSIGGYGEGHYSSYINDKGDKTDTADFGRLILYVGYKFTDRIILNTEIEYEHAKTGEGEDGEVAVEMASLDFLLDEKINLRAGLMLVPVGLTNELHEPTLFHGNDRPQVERDVIPTTWREMGAGAFGTLTPGLDYKVYVVNGLNAADFKNSGIRSGRQNGSKAKADDWAVVARLDYEPMLGLKLGGSTYLGNSGQGQEFAGKEVDAFTEIYELHAQYQYRGLELKALGAQVKVDDAEYLSEERGAEVAEEVTGFYLETAYNVLPHIIQGTEQYLAPFFRYENIEYEQARGASVAAGSSKDYKVYTVGVSYKPIPNVVLKADYRNFDRDEGTTADEANFGIGFIF